MKKISIFVSICILLLMAGGALALSNSGGGTWQYSRDITIDNSGSALTDYQVLVNLTGASFPVNARSDGADLRFTDAEGAELSYWIEEWDYANKSARVWVNVTDLTVGANTMRMWYGNQKSTSSSNGTRTFELFDDFNTLEGWTILNGGGTGSASATNFNGVNVARLYSPDNNNRIAIVKPFHLSNSGMLVETRASASTLNDGFMLGFSDGTTVNVAESNDYPQNGYLHLFLRYFNTKDEIINVYEGNPTILNSTPVSGNVNNWYVVGFSQIGDKFRNHIDRIEKLSANETYFSNQIYIHLSVAYFTTWNFDWILVRKYASFEPSVNVGAEQNSGPVAEYHFNGDANDSSGNGNNGTINGATFVQGVSGQALSFDGVDDYVNISNSATLMTNDSITIEAWVNPRELGVWDRVAFKCASDDLLTCAYVFGLSSHGGVYFAMFNGYSQTYIDGFKQIPTDEWTYMTGTWDGATMRIYINGVEQPETLPFEGPINRANSPLKLGLGYYSGDSYALNGTIDEVRIYNRALSADEIKTQYLELAPPTITINTNKANYKADNKMYVGLNVTNPGNAKKIGMDIWIDLPSGGRKMVASYPSVTLPAGLNYMKYPWMSVTLPNIPPGNYAWHAVLKNTTSGDIISESISPWTFSKTAQLKTDNIAGIETILQEVSGEVHFGK